MRAPSLGQRVLAWSLVGALVLSLVYAVHSGYKSRVHEEDVDEKLVRLLERLLEELTAVRTSVEAETPEPKETLPRLAHLARKKVKLTYYWRAVERLGEPLEVDLLGPNCEVLARVSQRFLRAAVMEGTGILRDGDYVNVHGQCDCATACFRRISERAGGLDSRGFPLVPLQSVAVHPGDFEYGDWLFAPALLGVEVGGQTLDGCLRAVDVGGGVESGQVDFFIGDRSNWKSLRSQVPKSIQMIQGAEQCEK